MSEVPKDICELVKSHNSFLITSHVNPEGDAIGSELAFASALKDMGKSVYVMNQDPVPYFLRFLPGAELIENDAPDTDYEVGVLLDCSSPGRAGVAGEYISRCRKIICIDHHLTNGGYGDTCYLDSGASSTGEMVFRLLKVLNVKITPEIATSLWVAILTDTGSFRYSNVTSNSLRVAAELIECGVSPGLVSENLYENEPKERIDLLSRVLSTLEMVEGGKIASITVYKRDMEVAGATCDFLDGLINYPRSIKGVRVAVSFREEDDCNYKISLRGKDHSDVARVASAFGGGGHVKASGFMIEGDFSIIKREVYRKIVEMLKERV